MFRKRGRWEPAGQKKPEGETGRKFPFWLIPLSLLLCLWSACGGGSGDNVVSVSSTPSAGTGSITFHIEFQGPPLSASDSFIPVQAALNCPDTGIATVTAYIYDASNSVLASGTWPCNAHSGTLTGVPAGSNRTLIIFGRDADGNNIYASLPVSGITVETNQTYNAGTISATPYTVTLLAPATGSSIVNCDFSFTWSGSGEGNFEIQIADKIDFSSIVVDQIVNGSPYTPTYLNSGNYYWRVRSDTMGNKSRWSDIWTCTVQNGIGQPPPPPTGLGAKPGDSQVTLQWDSVTGAPGFNLYCTTTPPVSKNSYEEKVSNILSGPYTHTGRTNGTTYYYVVTSVNSCGESSESSQVAIMAGRPPSAPTGVNAAAGDRQITISWNAVAGATSYNIYSSMSPGVSKAAGTKIANVGITSYTHTGIDNGRTYYYVVTAQNALGESSESMQVFAMPGAPPSAPTGVTATPGDRQVIISWNSVSGATGYYIYGSTFPNVSKSFYMERRLATSPFTHTGITNGTTYYYVVTAINSYGESTESSPVSATPGVPPSAPTGVSAAGGNTQVTITWGSVAGATSYNIYWRTSPGVNKSNGTKIPGVTSPYIHMGRINGTTYYYVVTAVNGYGESAESTQVSATPGAPPSAPSGVSAAGGDTQVTITWGSVARATSYNIYWRTTPGVNKSNGTKIPGITSPYIHTGRTNGTTYYYVVTAVNSYGESAESAQVSATPH